MCDSESNMTIRVTGRAAQSDAAAAALDPRTAEVLRALQRAKGTAVQSGSAAPVPATDLASEVLALRAVLASCSPSVRDAEQSLTGRARVLEGALAAITDKLMEFQRAEDRTVRELRDSVLALKREADTLAAWHAWTTRRVAAWGVVLAVLASAGLGLSGRAHQTSRRTQAVLEEILENQAAAQAEAQVRQQAGPGAKRR